MKKTLVMDLTPLHTGRVHLHGFDCSMLRALRNLQNIVNSNPLNRARVEFWQTTNTNPVKVKCVDCWREHPEVAKTFISRVVIDIRKKP